MVRVSFVFHSLLYTFHNCTFAEQCRQYTVFVACLLLQVTWVAAPLNLGGFYWAPPEQGHSVVMVNPFIVELEDSGRGRC